MKKILLSLAALLVIGLSVNAKTIAVDLTTVSSVDGNAGWDKETGTFSWKDQSWNSIVLPGLSGDLMGYKTLKFTVAETNEAFRVYIKFSNGSSQVTVWVNKDKNTISGEQTVDLEAAGASQANLGFVSSMHISGPNWEGNKTGSIVISNVYLEGPDTKVYYPQVLYPIGGTNLDASLYHLWTTPDKDAEQKEDPTYPAVNLNSSTGLPYGDGNVGYLNYANLSSYDKLVVVAKDGEPRFCFNRLTDGGTVDVEFPRDKETGWETVVDNGNGYKTYIVNLAAIVEAKGYAHLICIKGANYANTTITKMFILKADESISSVDEARTYSYSEVLDFSEVTDVDAYIATSVVDGKVAMQKVTGAVPANTGLVLVDKTGKSVVSIPTCETVTEDVTGNLLVATTEETTVPAGAYVLAGTGDDLGWYVIGSTPATLAAGKCYLAASAGAKVLNMSFEDATAIKSVEKTTISNNTIYSLQGIKVATPVKGNMYIQNGKKIIF